MSAISPRSGIQVSSVYPTYTHIKGQSPLCVCVHACVCECVCVCMHVCVCVAKPVAVELHCHASALIFMPPTLKKWGAYWFRLVRMYVCTYVRMYSCSRYRLETSCMDSSWKNSDAYFWFSLNYLPLSNYGPLTNKGMKFCKCHISKSIIARNLKLVSADRG